MKVIFSRKEFDSSTGGAPSPIVDGRLLSLPIPTADRFETTHGDLGIGEAVEDATKGRHVGDRSPTIANPMFENGRCALGQTGESQTHLADNHVGVGDAFLFFGLFAQPDTRDKHHRFFGYLLVDEVMTPGRSPTEDDQPAGFSLRHPHTIGHWSSINTIYVGAGEVAQTAEKSLRLSRQGGPVSRWRVPSWLFETGLTYHERETRWEPPNTLNTASRGQEFICDISDRTDARQWLDGIVDAIRRAR